MKPRYFTHDFEAGRDSKILKMRADGWGVKGVGLYWLTIEYLFSVNGRGRLDELELAAIHMGEKFKIVSQFCEDCIHKYGLFSSDGELFWSNRLLLELQNAKRKSERARANGSKRNKNGYIKSNSDNELEESVNQSQQSHSKAIAQPQQSCSSAKERKKKRKKEIKKEVYGTFNNVYLANSEYSNCLEKYGELTTRMAIEELSSYKESTGKQYKSDYAAMIRWVFKTILDAQSKQQTTLRSCQDVEFRPRDAVSIYDKLSGDENKND